MEITERSLIDLGRAAPVVRSLRAEGVLVAIDDFSTCYSNLAELERWEVDCLKIDRSFVESIDTGAATSRVVTAIIEMARSRGLTMVVEGIETSGQRAYLLAMASSSARGGISLGPCSSINLWSRSHCRDKRQVPPLHNEVAPVRTDDASRNHFGPPDEFPRGHAQALRPPRRDCDPLPWRGRAPHPPTAPVAMDRCRRHHAGLPPRY